MIFRFISLFFGVILFQYLREPFLVVIPLIDVKELSINSS